MRRKVFGSYTNIFDRYDKLRRKQEFELLKDVCKFNFGIDNVWEDSFEIPVFNKDKRKVFAIQMKNNQGNFRVAIYFKNSYVLSVYHRNYGEYTSYVLTLNEAYNVMNKFIASMCDFLGVDELFFTEITEDESTKLFHETDESYKKLERGIY